MESTIHKDNKKEKHIILIKGIDAYSWHVLKVFMVKLK